MRCPRGDTSVSPTRGYLTASMAPRLCQRRAKSDPFVPVEYCPPWGRFWWFCLLAGVDRWWSGAVRSGAVGVAVQGDDVGVVDEAVDGRGRDDVIAEGLSPAREREVRGRDHGPGLVSRGDELEETMRPRPRRRGGGRPRR